MRYADDINHANLKQNDIANHLDDEFEGSAGLYPDDRKIQVSRVHVRANDSNTATCSAFYNLNRGI